MVTNINDIEVTEKNISLFLQNRVYPSYVNAKQKRNIISISNYAEDLQDLNAKITKFKGINPIRANELYLDKVATLPSKDEMIDMFLLKDEI